MSMLKVVRSIHRACLSPRKVALALFVGGLIGFGAIAAQEKGKPVRYSRPEGKAPAPFSTWDALYAEQQRLNAAAEKIVEARSGQGDDGYAGLIVNPTYGEVRLYWKGAIPSAVKARVQNLKTSVPVKTFAARYSEKELIAESERWVASGKANGAGPLPDGRGVAVSVATSAAMGAPRLSGSTIPVEVEYGSVETLNYNRQDDMAPYYGGGNYSLWSDASGGWIGSCSLAFPITDFEGYPGFLTAGHCGNAGQFVDSAYENDGESHIGWYYELPGWEVWDTAFISSYEDNAPRIFTGDAFSSASRGVAYAQDPFPGNWVASSGARTGEHSGLLVFATNWTSGIYKGLTRATQYQFGCAAAPGDSGGPIFSYAGDGRIIAHGIHHGSGGTPTSPCTGYNYGDTSGPSGIVEGGGYRISFVPIKAMLQRTGASLRTSPTP